MRRLRFFMHISMRIQQKADGSMKEPSAINCYSVLTPSVLSKS